MCLKISHVYKMRGLYKHMTEKEKLAAGRKQRRAYQKKKWNCDICGLVIDIGSKCNHLRTNAHRVNQRKRSRPAELRYKDTRLAGCSPKVMSRYIFGIDANTKSNSNFWKKISCAYKMEPISLFSLAAIKCINDRNTHSNFKHIMSITESKEYIKHLVAFRKRDGL